MVKLKGRKAESRRLKAENSYKQKAGQAPKHARPDFHVHYLPTAHRLLPRWELSRRVIVYSQTCRLSKGCHWAACYTFALLLKAGIIL